MVYGLHGVINNIPPNEVSVQKEWIDDEYVMTAKGKIKQSRFYGEDFSLVRTKRSITIEIEINKHMVLYSEV